jgi:hypothetical protein
MTEEVQTTETVAAITEVVGELRIALDDKAIVFRPADDLTPVELSHLMVMFINGLVAKNKIDFGSYIEQKNLGRHFSLLTEPEKAE